MNGSDLVEESMKVRSLPTLLVTTEFLLCQAAAGSKSAAGVEVLAFRVW